MAGSLSGAAYLNVVTEGAGADISVRITKQEGPGFHIVPEGTPGLSTVAVRRVNELDYYNLNATQVADKAGITTPKLLAVIAHLGIQDDPDCYKEIAIGKARYKRYSQNGHPYVSQLLGNRRLGPNLEEPAQVYAEIQIMISLPSTNSNTRYDHPHRITVAAAAL